MTTSVVGRINRINIREDRYTRVNAKKRIRKKRSRKKDRKLEHIGYEI